MLPQPLKGRPDAASGTERATPIAGGRGASAEGAIQGGAAASSDGASAGQDTQKTPTPDAGRVGPPVSSTADAPAGTVAQPSALEPTYPAFKKEAVDQAAKQNDKSREILVDMPIDDFLAAAKQEKSPEKLAAVKDLLSKVSPLKLYPRCNLRTTVMVQLRLLATTDATVQWPLKNVARLLYPSD
jgi:hypothetical protein